MHLTLDHHSGVPISAQIAEQIKYRIVSGELAAGEQLPSVRALAAQLRLNPTTVARVYRQLDAEGVLTTQPGRGIYVATRPPGFTRAEQRRRLEPELRRLAVEAARLGVPFAELEEWMREEIERIESTREERP